MKSLRRYPKFFLCALVAVCCLGWVRPAKGYSISRTEKWPDGVVVYDLLMGSSGTLLDGSTSWDEVAEGALATWNLHMGRLEFRVATVPVDDVTFGNGRNSASYNTTAGGTPFGSSTLAITRTRISGNNIVEADVYFNTSKSWNSYRGPLRVAASGGYLVDLRRVALHEFGHALGLNHPDDFGQNVVAVMNAVTSNTDDLTADDIAGAQAIYGVKAAAPAPVTYRIQATASPASKGIVRGAGKYALNIKVTLRAVPKAGRRFVYWAENRKIVSRNATYKFFSNKPRTLVAYFK